ARLDVGAEVEEVAAGLDCHGDLFEGGVAGALADAVDAGLDLASTGANGAQAVGDGEAEVVVAVDGDAGLVDVADVVEDAFDELAELFGRGVADGVGDVDGGCAGVDDVFEHAVDVLPLAAGGVHGAELDVFNIALG